MHRVFPRLFNLDGNHRQLCFFFISLFQQGRLSDDDSADTLDELDPPSEKGQSLNRLQTDKEQKSLPTEETNTVPPNESR